MFGAPLNNNPLKLIGSLCAFLKKSNCAMIEGIFRLSADTEQQERWVAKLDADPLRSDLNTITDGNLVANLLKRYLRMLDPPLLTYALYDAFLDACSDSSDEELMVDKLCSCVMKLPPLNHDILAELLQLLIVIMEYEDKNRMGVDNLATVFGPCLIHKQTANGMTDIMNLGKEADVVAQLLRNAARIVKLERVGARPRDTGDSSSSFPGVRLLSDPSFSSSPVLGRKGAPPNPPAGQTSPKGSKVGSGSGTNTPVKTQMMAYAKYDYKGSPAAETLTLSRGEALTVLEMPGKNERWCKCSSRDSNEEGWVPISFLDCPGLPKVMLGRERALSRAGSSVVPISSPLRKPDISSPGGMTSPRRMSQPQNVDPLLGLTKGSSVKTVEEMADRMDILSRALVKEKEERMMLEKRLNALVQNSAK